MNTTLPCVLMRAGTSRGPFFLRDWLPADPVARDETLIGAIGASDLLQVDGVGGGSTLTSKVAIVSRSERDDCDVDYLFAQVGVGQRSVDTRPNCGNMLSGVAPFAIEQGLVEAADGTTTVRVFNVNTRSRIDVTVRTPGRRVTYEGDVRIDGVAGTAAPIHLNFLDAWGAVTGKVFPTGRRIDLIDGVEATCIDAAMPLMIVRAESLGVDGREQPGALDANAALMQRIEALRLEAGRLMGLGDVSASVIPKPVLVSRGDGADSVTSRYFTPRRCHASHAVTGAIGVAAAFALPGTVASGETPSRAAATSSCCIRPAASTSRSSSRPRAANCASGAPRCCARRGRSCRASCTSPTTCIRGRPRPTPRPRRRSPRHRRRHRHRHAAPPRHRFPRGRSRSSCRRPPAAATTPWRTPSRSGSARCSASRW